MGMPCRTKLKRAREWLSVISYDKASYTVKSSYNDSNKTGYAKQVLVLVISKESEVAGELATLEVPTVTNASSAMVNATEDSSLETSTASSSPACCPKLLNLTIRRNFRDCFCAPKLCIVYASFFSVSCEVTKHEGKNQN